MLKKPVVFMSALKHIFPRLPLVLILLVYSAVCGATNVSLSGNWSYQYSGNTAVVLSVDRITNLQSSGTSGSLRMELWAFATPFDGTTQSGYHLADYTLSALSAGFSYNNISSGTVSAILPPTGAWYMALLLTEFVGNNRWVVRDYINADTSLVLKCSGGTCSSTNTSSRPPTANISINGTSFLLNNGSTFTMSGNVHAGNQTGTPSSIFVQAQLNGQQFYLGPGNVWSKNVVPLVANFNLNSVIAPKFHSLTLNGLPPGAYSFSVIVTKAGTSPAISANVLASGSTTATFSLPPVLDFNPPATLPAATVGSAYQYDFSSFASGGNPPYHFQLDTLGGFPPIGLVLGLDGILSGTPSIAGSTVFAVCAVDLSADQSCTTVGITVNPQGTPGTSITGTWIGTWTRPVGGLCDLEASELTWTLVQSGSSITGTYSRRITAVDTDGLCPDPVGTVLTGSLFSSNYNGGPFTLTTDGGTPFNVSLSGSIMSGTGGSSLGSGPVSLTRQ